MKVTIGMISISLLEVIMLILTLDDGAQHLRHCLDTLSVLLNKISFAEILLRTVIDFYLHLLPCFYWSLPTSDLIIRLRDTTSRLVAGSRVYTGADQSSTLPDLPFFPIHILCIEIAT